jgi:hypothetical protein
MQISQIKGQESSAGYEYASGNKNALLLLINWSLFRVCLVRFQIH